MFTSSTVRFGIFVVVAIGLLALAQAAAGPFVASAGISSPQAQNPPLAATATLQTKEPTPAAKAKSAGGYSDLFIQKFAERLGVDQDKLQAAYTGALSDTLSQAVRDGNLTQADADAIVQKMGPEGLRMLAPISEKLEAKSYDPGRDQFYVNLKLTVAHAFAQALGISDQELQSEWAQGKSIAAVAQARGLNPDQVKQAALSNLKTALDQAVQAGKLQQAEEDKIYKDMEPAMEGLMNGK